MALWQTWWGIQMCCEAEPGLEPLKKAYVKPTSCGIKTTAQAIILSCAVKSSWWGQWWNMTRNTCKNFEFCLYPKHDYAFDSWDGMRQFLHPGLQEGRSTDDKTDWMDLAAPVIAIWFSLLHSPCLTVLLSAKKWMEPTHRRDRPNQTEPGRALSRLSQAMARNSGMPCSAQ